MPVSNYVPHVPQDHPDLHMQISQDYSLNDRILCRVFRDYQTTARCIDFIKGTNDAINVNLMPGIKKVIFNNPATIVYWTDGTKTVVKAGDNDTFDKETGLAMAIAKRVFIAYGCAYPRGSFKRIISEAQDCSKPRYECSEFEKFLTDLLAHGVGHE